MLFAVLLLSETFSRSRIQYATYHRSLPAAGPDVTGAGQDRLSVPVRQGGLQWDSGNSRQHPRREERAKHEGGERADTQPQAP